jgi:hypothetical protein
MQSSSSSVRLLLVPFLWVGFYAGSYLLLDALGLWSRLPGGLAHGLNLVTGSVLVLALAGHLILATGRIPEPPARDLDASVTPPKV